jgi:hypothetical protein
MTKATASPRRTGQLGDRHCANSVVTTRTIASSRIILRHGHKTMMTATPGRAPALGQDSLPCRPSLLDFSLSQAHDLTVGRT